MSRDIVAALCPLAGYACTLGLGGVVAHPLPTPINMTAHARSRFMPCPPSVELALGQASDDGPGHRNYLAGLAELRKLASEGEFGATTFRFVSTLMRRLRTGAVSLE
jgi:hypothetical protein